MATYLTGSNKYIPQIQPYQPDLNFYKSVLDTKTAQYEAGYDRVNSIYGTLLNSPLTRQDTSGMRNDFFSKANNEIQRLAGVDLSIEDNQTAAFQVFKPLTTNKLFAKDVNFTKDLYAEYDRSEFFRDCINEKECGGKYWQGGVDYLQYKAKDFAEADEKTAMGMESPKYVPFVNVVGDAVDFALKSKIEMQTVTSDGRYIYTTTNGQPMQAPLHSYFISKYGNDQRVADMYNVSAYLQRKNYGQEKASQFGSTQAAEADYIQQIISAADKANREYKKAAENTKEDINAKKGIVEDYVKTRGVDPEIDKDLIEYYRRLNDDEAIAETADTFYKESLDISSPTSMEGLSQTQLAYRADAILARNLLDGDMASAASAYASMTQKQDVKADPIYIENLNFSHQMSLESFKQQNDWKKSAWTYANDLEKKLWESRLDTDVAPGKFEKSLGMLAERVTSAMSALGSFGFGEDEDEDSDVADSDGRSKKKTPEQLKYEVDLRENAVKQKIQKENELEYYIHELRGHTSAQVWESMGKEKMASLGFTDRNQLLFLDSQEQQINDAKQLYAAKEKGIELSQTDELRANAYAMGWGADTQSYSQHLNEWGPYIKSSPLAKVAAGQGATSEVKKETSSNFNTDESASTSANTPTPASTNNTSNTTAVDSAAQVIQQILTVPDSSSTSAANTNYIEQRPDSITTANTTNPVSTQLATDNSTDVAADISTPAGEAVKMYESFGFEVPAELRQKAQEEQYFAQNPEAADQVAGTMFDAATNYVRAVGGKEKVPDQYMDDIIGNIKSYLVGSTSEEASILGAIMPYSDSNPEEAVATASKVDPTSTQEFKNIQIPSNSELMDALYNGGLALFANKLESRNAITAGRSEEANGMRNFKAETVDLIVSKYQNKIRNGNANEKKSALNTLKKIFPKYALMNWIGANGEIKSPVAGITLPVEESYTNALNTFTGDPMFRDDVKDNEDIVQATSMVNIQMQTEDSRIKIDQYNIAQVGNKMLTNPDLVGEEGLAPFMDKYFFKNMGFVFSPNTPANGSPLKAVRTREDFEKDVYGSEKIWAAADVMADAMMGVTVGPAELGAHVMKHPGLLMDDDMNPALFAVNLQTMAYLEKGQKAFNPSVLKRFNTAANKALGIEGERENFWQFVANAYSNKPKPLQEGDSGVKYTVEKLNNYGINGKELLKNALMETWASEGRTSEWTIYDEYAKKNNGQVPRLDYQEIPILGYDKFIKEYGLAAADENTNLQMYTPKNLMGDAYSGQGGDVALPYKINFNEGLDLATGTGNQDMIGLIDNAYNVLNSTGRDVPYYERGFVLDMPYADVVKELDVSDKNVEDWNWQGNDAMGAMGLGDMNSSLESKHKKQSEGLMQLMGQIRNDLSAQANVDQFHKLDLLEGVIKTYPIAVGTSDMTAYQVTLNGDYIKSKGFQDNSKDKIFTILIPKYKAENTLYKRAVKSDWVDLALWANGSANIEVPNAGKISITQDNQNNYIMNGQMYLPDSITGQITLQQLAPQTVNQSTLPGWLFADQIFQQLFNSYKNNQQYKRNTRDNAELTRDPQALLN